MTILDKDSADRLFAALAALAAEAMRAAILETIAQGAAEARKVSR